MAAVFSRGFDALLVGASADRTCGISAPATSLRRPVSLVARPIDLLAAAIEYLEAVAVEFYLHQQNIGTTTSIAGAASWTLRRIRAPDHEMSAGLKAIKAAIERVHLQVRPGARTPWQAGVEPEKTDRTCLKLAKGIAIGKVTRLSDSAALPCTRYSGIRPLPDDLEQEHYSGYRDAG